MTTRHGTRGWMNSWDTDCTGEKLAWGNEDYCISVVKKKAAEKNSCDTNFQFDGCIHLATKKIKCSPR